ncbi:rod shape-determining protein MreC [uncultured Pseudacidovorax sp.]|uniref:rod shape-determining protein MreC n=1 Tax=uncultured Pseudacidovorax sp. TaxID=679313 RepID=UPI0025CE0879|nr:rod shape-determining protein MreC [uncultured Pseudacidovorax sp.]
MPFGTLDRSAPPLFNQGPSALSRFIFCGALAIFLMVADARFDVVAPVRAALAAMMFPLQWAVLKPVQWVAEANRRFEDVATAQRNEAEARRRLVMQSERASQADALARENARLRTLLELRQNAPTPGRAAEVLYDAADPYTRKVVIDQGQVHGIAPGSPVIDELGVLGQVTLVSAFTSEVTLVIDRDLAIPVQNSRTGARSVAFGDAGPHSAGMELRFTAANADVREGDLLSTSGVDGVYPAGLPVARVDRIDRRADTAFARIHCVPLSRVGAARYVMVLTPVGEAPQAARPPVPATEPRRFDKVDRPGRKPEGNRTEASALPAVRASQPAQPAVAAQPAAPATPAARAAPSAPADRPAATGATGAIGGAAR